MCGVIGLIFENHRQDLGLVAAELLKTLEYRGYDSTGAAIQGEGEDVHLVKGVGAPSLMVHQLGVVEQAGSIFCGQVRWATFGAVTEQNAQPHLVRCRPGLTLYGAHNGNVTNCDQLKAWLTDEGHQVTSDNDGEMVVHTVEHYFHRELTALPQERRLDAEARRACMRRAWLAAASRLDGSFAAVVVDPVSRVVWAVKQGSSLYFGVGKGGPGGHFCIASSDLSSILKLTRVVVPLREGEMVEYTARGGYQLFAVKDLVRDTPQGRVRVAAGQPMEREPRRSRLRAKDTGLLPPFETFMDQEISAQEHTCHAVTRIFSGGSDGLTRLRPALDAVPPEDLATIRAALDELRDQYDDDDIRRRFHALADVPAMRALVEGLSEQISQAHQSATPERLALQLASAEAGFFADLLPMARGPRDLPVALLMDALLEGEEVAEYAQAVERFGDRCLQTVRQGGRIYVTCCGSSYHAAKAGALFFNDLAHVELAPLLPGEFRGQVSRCLKDGDLFIAVSQSGETKDLIDVLNDVIRSGLNIGRVALVNNVNSTLAQEKCNLVIPLRCGPEIAVPATKSFINQVMLFYLLALRLGERRLEAGEVPPGQAEHLAGELVLRREKLPTIPTLIRETVAATAAEVEEAAHMLYLSPSIHIMATRLTAVAKEGALKVREVVLNHTEGFEGSEFKHGPNTILGFNTLLGPLEVETLLSRLGRTLDQLVLRASEQGADVGALRRLVQAAADAPFSPTSPALSLNPGEGALFNEVVDRADLLSVMDGQYPLIYITGADERDTQLTVSQINTHKIRGANTVVIAEEHPALRQAATKAPAGCQEYRAVYIQLPRTNDTLMACFSATVVLQRLALEMSLHKKAYLDRLGIKDHGVHPDVPKNVSKSITVD